MCSERAAESAAATDKRQAVEAAAAAAAAEGADRAAAAEAKAVAAEHALAAEREAHTDALHAQEVQVGAASYSGRLLSGARQEHSSSVCAH